MRLPVFRFVLSLSLLLGWTACSDDDTDGDSTGDAGDQTTQDMVSETTEDSGTPDAVEETTGDMATGDMATDTVESGTIAVQGTLSLADNPIDPVVDGENAGGYMFALLPGGYTMTGDPSEDIIAAGIWAVPDGYDGASIDTGDTPIVLKVWDGTEENEGDPLLESDFEGEAGTYSLLVVFMSKFDNDDDGPEYLAGPTDHEVTEFPGVIDVGEISLPAMNN